MKVRKLSDFSRCPGRNSDSGVFHKIAVGLPSRRKVFQSRKTCLGMEIKKNRRFYVSRNSWAAQAERRVRRILEELPMDHFLVMNDIKFKYGNIDHLVIRDDGRIFLIETKPHRGTVTFDGKRLLVNGRPFKRNPICQMNRTIRWLRQFTCGMWCDNPWFVAVLVFPKAAFQEPKIIKHVNIMEIDDLVAFICSYS